MLTSPFPSVAIAAPVARARPIAALAFKVAIRRLYLLRVIAYLANVAPTMALDILHQTPVSVILIHRYPSTFFFILPAISLQLPVHVLRVQLRQISTCASSGTYTPRSMARCSNLVRSVYFLWL